MSNGQFKRNERGAVMMEYVIIAVLIAAACVIGVVVFSRSVFYGIDMSAKGATSDSAKVKDVQTLYRQQLDENAKSAKDYHDSMHTGKANQP